METTSGIIRSNPSISKWAVRLIAVSIRSSEIFEMSFARGHRQDLQINKYQKKKNILVE